MLKLHWRKAKVKVHLTTCVSFYLGEILEKNPKKQQQQKNMQNKVASVESRLYIAVVPLLGTVYRQIIIKK